MKRAEVLQHGVLRECTCVLQRISRSPLLPWEKDRREPDIPLLAAKIGGIELQDGGEYLLICDEKRYTVRIEMALGLSNHGRVVTEWPDRTKALGAIPPRQVECW